MIKRLIGKLFLLLDDTVTLAGITLPKQTLVVFKAELMSMTPDIDKLLMVIAFQEHIYDHYGRRLSYHQMAVFADVLLAWEG